MATKKDDTVLSDEAIAEAGLDKPTGYITAEFAKKMRDTSKMDMSQVQLVSNSTFSEIELRRIIVKTVGDGLGFAMAAQLAIGGYTAAGKNRTQMERIKVIYKDEEVFYRDFAAALNIRKGRDNQASGGDNGLTDQQLTMSRVIRAYKHEIVRFLKSKTGIMPKLFKKYAGRLAAAGVKIPRHYCFNSGIHAIPADDEASHTAWLHMESLKDAEEVERGEQEKDEKKWQKKAEAVYYGKLGAAAMLE